METLNEDILIQYLEGKLPKDEVARVEEWLAASVEHRRTLEQLYYTLEVVNRLHVMRSVNPDDALQRFKSRVHTQNRKATLRRYLATAQRIAAVLFIPLLILSVYLGMPKSEEAVRMVEVRTNPGVVSAFSLPDGSRVWLSAASSLKYPSAFTADDRKVELEGQGYFEVTRDTEHPFIVQAGPDYAVEVLGTSFNVAAYTDEDLIETTLVEGAVNLHIHTAGGKNLIRKLKPNEKAAFKKTTRQLEIATVDTEYDTAWKNGEIIFRNHPMEQVLRVLSRHYHVKFHLKDEEVLRSIITARFKDEPLPQVMEYLRLASGIKYTLQQSSITSDQTLEIPLIEISK